MSIAPSQDQTIPKANLMQPTQKSVTLDMANRFGMEPGAFEATVRATCGAADCTREEFAAFLMVARDYNLNPILREMFAFPKKGGGIQPIVSVDGWLTMINRHPQFDGLEFEDVRENGNIVAIEARIYRKDRSKPTIVIEYMSECSRATDPWKQWPARMLRHKAMIQCARYSFGFSGIMDPDEAERMVDITPIPERPQITEFAKPVSASVAAQGMARITDGPNYDLIDEFGAALGNYRAARFASLMLGAMENLQPEGRVAFFEHNEAAVSDIEETGVVFVGDIVEMYTQALVASQPSEETKEPDVQVVIETTPEEEPEEPEKPVVVERDRFWSNETLSHPPESKGKGFNWDAWGTFIRARASEAISVKELTDITTANKGWLDRFTIANPEGSAEMKKHMKECAQKLGSA